VILAIGQGNKAFVAASCVNIVVAANAGGAFSPFGDITTLMVWQKGLLHFFEFFALFLPSLTNWLVPAICLSFVIPSGRPQFLADDAGIKPGGRIVIGLFAFTIMMTVCMHQFLHLPPFLGMMTGLGLLQLFGYFMRRQRHSALQTIRAVEKDSAAAAHGEAPLDIFENMKHVEWDTLLFFYGVILCVGGLGALGYLTLLSHASYAVLGTTTANVLVGFASAVIDNIPIMFSVLSTEPQMSEGQWLLVTLTAGVGGSLLSIGSGCRCGTDGPGARRVYVLRPS
jgi:Na+/H+ antiporter NhaD/arsenite permease-like protein